MDETKNELTTAELFSTLLALATGVPRGAEVSSMEGERLVFMLERRMGAMVRAARRLLDNSKSQHWRDANAELCDLRAALTDAPPVFTLEEVRDAVIKAVSLVQGTGLAETIASDAVQHLAALRSTECGR